MRVVFLLTLLLLLKLPALAQNAGLRPKPVSLDNTLVLTLPDEGQALWQRAGQLLAQRGYAIRYASPELLTLSTEVIAARSGPSLGITLTVVGHELQLRGYIDYTNIHGTQLSQSNSLMLIDYEEGNGRRARQWQELEDVARLLGGTRQYTRVGID
ncbi:hypothetical protein KLP40_18525 [Hymenobacter sp. NST-14]|uniref:hypothetical protein n=1 Tax=Hymenobacter piscis TaxID=2839984 RepID=UPI001C00D265|nr:hypothetical protein [Hymenobacter piscis]MBT9395170.1 hypothetical protein [Hymenobacter piscis]